jgi:hypothetical protein
VKKSVLRKRRCRDPADWRRRRRNQARFTHRDLSVAELHGNLTIQPIDSTMLERSDDCDALDNLHACLLLADAMTGDALKQIQYQYRQPVRNQYYHQNQRIIAPNDGDAALY